jgi:putative flippase GtrA
MLRLARSAGVGAVATVVDVFLLLCLVELGGVAPALANVPALLGGLAVQFVGNSPSACCARAQPSRWSRWGQWR